MTNQNTPNTPVKTTKPHNEDNKKDKSGANPIFAIAIAIAIAGLLSGISLVAFLQSDTVQTVKLIQQQNQDDDKSSTNFEGIDTTSLPTSEDLDTIQSDLQQSVSSLNDEANFNPAELTDGALGL